MRNKRGLLLFFIPLFVWLLTGQAYASDYSQIQESNTLNYTGDYYYGKKLQKLTGDFTESGVSGIPAERPVYLSRWQAIYTENIKTGKTMTQDNYDVFNLMETQPTDNFQNRQGYGLLPLDETTIKSYLSAYLNADQNQQNYIWNNKIGGYTQFTQEGYYELMGDPYIRVSQLVTFAGGKWVENTDTTDDLSDMSQSKGTAHFHLSPGPQINSANGDGSQISVDFNAYGYSNRDIKITIKGDKGSKTYTYNGVTATNFHDVWTKDMSDFSSSTGTKNLQVIIDDGFGREVSSSVNIKQQQEQQNPTPSGPKIVGVSGAPLKMKFGDLPNSVAMFSDFSVPVIIGNDGDKPVTTNLNFTLTGQKPKKVTICDAEGSCETVWRSFSLTETTSSGQITIPAHGVYKWIVSNVTITSDANDPPGSSNGSLNAGGVVDAATGFPDTFSAYAPLIQVNAQDPQDYISPHIEVTIGTNYSKPTRAIPHLTR